MQTLHLDSDDYADMLDFIATGGRAGSLPAQDCDQAKFVADMWAPRARAMTGAVVAIAHAAIDSRA
jgi:hypothetical protein